MISFPFGWSQNKLLLVAGNALFGIVLIVLANIGVLPLDPVNFLFFSFVGLLFALYRPGWAFLFFVGTLPFETVNLWPAAFGNIILRPYQWIALLLALTILLRLIARKLPFGLPRLSWFDWLLLLVPAGAFVAAINAPSTGAAVKQAIILISFALAYALARVFWRSFDDVKQALPFFLSSSIVVFSYALWQNLRFLAGQESFQAMAGRPNATFSEADWLGLFIIIALSVAYVFVYQMFSSKEQRGMENGEWRMENGEWNPKIYLVAFFLVFAFIILIITVARSAWLGAFASAAVFCLLILFSQGLSRMREMLPKAFSFGSTLVASFALSLVVGLHLTPFQLFSRAQSTASGLQKITVACEKDIVLPEKIAGADELAPLGCRHIDLEAIEAEKDAGMFVKETYRDDPNISIRKEIYGKVRELIRSYPVIGIGWGSAAMFLGSDESGAGLNASNMFLEVWLGSGIVGLIAFVIFWFAVMIAAVIGFFRGEETMKPLYLLVASAWAGVTVFNLFNSGILLGFFFLYLALGALVIEISKKLWIPGQARDDKSNT